MLSKLEVVICILTVIVTVAGAILGIGTTYRLVTEPQLLATDTVTFWAIYATSFVSPALCIGAVYHIIWRNNHDR